MRRKLFLLPLALLSLASCGGTSAQTSSAIEKEEGLKFVHENTENVVKEGEDLYYRVNGENKSHVFGFYDNSLYYFSDKDFKGIQFTVVQVTEHITAVNVTMGSTVYIVEGDTRGAVIDTAVGIGDTKAMVELFLGDKPFDVMLTHTHVDHVGGIFNFATTWTTQQDADVASLRWSLEGRLNYANVTETSGKYAISDFTLETETYPFSILEDGKTFDLGNYNIQVFTAAGHTLGSAMYLMKEDRMILTGDNACPSTLLAFDSDPAAHTCATIEAYEENIKNFNKNNSLWDKVLTSHTSGSKSEKTMIDDLITCCDNIKESNPNNAEGEGENKFSKAVNGTKIRYNTARVWNS